MDNLVVKHNTLTNATYNLDLVEQRLILLAIVDARRSGKGITANDPLNIAANDYAQQFGTTRQASYSALKNACENLFNRYFKYVEGNKNIKSRWVSQIAYIDDLARVELIFSPTVVPLITELERHFTQYAIEQIVELNSAYAVRLYELLMSWRGTQKTEFFTISELRGRLGVDNSDYSRLDNFKRRVLDIAIEQINQRTDITAKYEQYKTGRVVTGFSFSFKFKKTNSKPTEMDSSLGTNETSCPLSLDTKSTKQQEEKEKAADLLHLKKIAELAGVPVETLLKRH